MAGRIRSIKPEILDDEKCAALSHLEFRIFVGSWLIADDYGNLRGDPDYVRAQIVWCSRESRDTVAKALEGLARVSLMVPYTVRGQSYLHVLGWAKHQKVDKPGKARMPGPDEAEFQSSQPPASDSRDPRESLAKSRETLATDLRPPTSDPDPEEISLPRAIPPSTESAVATTLELRQAARVLIWRELAEARDRAALQLGIKAQPLMAFDPGERALSGQLTAARTTVELEAVVAQARHVIAVAEAEATRDDNRSVQWLTGVIFEERNWRTAAGKSLDDARRIRAGPGRRGDREQPSHLTTIRKVPQL